MTEFRVWRSTLQAGQWGYIWSWLPNLTGAMTLTRSGKVTPAEAWEVGWPKSEQCIQLHRGFRIPDGTRPGTYHLQVGGRPFGDVTVIPTPPVTAPAIMNSSGLDDAARLENNLATHDVILQPGTYYLDRAINVPAGRTLAGYGATLIGPTSPLFYRGEMLRIGNGVTLNGLTFRSREFVVAFANHAERVTISNCTFANCSPGYWGRCDGLLVDRCLFDRGGTGPVMGGLWLNCKWEGLGGDHGFVTEGAHGPLAMLGCWMDGTDRGPVFRSGWGLSDMPLIAGLRLTNIDSIPNGNEIISCEAAHANQGIERLQVFGLRAHNCTGQINLWSGPVNQARFMDGQLNGGMGFAVGAQDGPMRGIELIDYELQGGNVQWAGDSADCFAERVHVTGLRRTRGNQTGPHSPGGPNNPWEKPIFAFDSSAAALPKCINCTLRDSPSTVGRDRGVVWTGPGVN